MMKENKVCKQCGKRFYRGKLSPSAFKRRTYCSTECQHKSMIGKILSPKTVFKKCNVGWNKGKGKWGDKQPTCKDCGAKISYASIRCKSCSRKREKSWRWKGGKITTSKGYVYLLKPDNPMANKKGYVAEHRLIMSEKIGRPIKDTEHIHHINGKKGDNRVENLIVLNSHTHFLITLLQSKINKLKKENKKLKLELKELKNEGVIRK